jgi:quercetin dioxygenase-like cupin family protein
MNMNNITTQKINWDSLALNELKGETGSTLYKEVISDGVRVRLAEYSAGYKSAEWCDKGHIIHCIKGEFTLHLKNGSNVKLTEGDSILLGSSDPHTATTGNISAVIFIIDNA